MAVLAGSNPTVSSALAAHAGKESAFAQQAKEVLEQLQRALHGLILAVGTTNGNRVPVRRAVDLERALKVDRPLAWRTFRVAHADHALLAAPYVPSRGQLARLMEAARAFGVAEGVLGEVASASETYETLVHEHAGDRDALNTMIAALQPGENSQIDEKTRRTAFKVNTQIWGLQCDLLLRCVIVRPEDDELVRMASVGGHIGLHTIRPNVPLNLPLDMRTGELVTRSATMEVARSTGSVQAVSFEVLREFSSPGLEVRSEIDAAGDVHGRWAFPGVGRQASIDMCRLNRSEHQMNVEQRGFFGTWATVKIPASVVHIDVAVPAGLTNPGTTKGMVYGNRANADASADCRPEDLLPIQVQVSSLSNVVDMPAAAGVPRYTEMIRHVLEKSGWYGERFDVYRCRVTYPVMHAMVKMTVDTWKK